MICSESITCGWHFWSYVLVRINYIIYIIHYVIERVKRENNVKNDNTCNIMTKLNDADLTAIYTKKIEKNDGTMTDTQTTKTQDREQRQR